MAILIENGRTANVFDRRGHHARQTILPERRFNHLVNADIHLEERPTERDAALFLIYYVYTNVLRVHKLNLEQHFINIMHKSFTQAQGKGKKKELTEERRDDYQDFNPLAIKISSLPRIKGVEVEILNLETLAVDVDDVVINLTKRTTGIKIKEYVEGTKETRLGRMLDLEVLLSDLNEQFGQANEDLNLNENLPTIRELDDAIFKTHTIKGGE